MVMIYQAVQDDWVLAEDTKKWILFQKGKFPQFLDLNQTSDFLFSHPSYIKLELSLIEYLEAFMESLRKPDLNQFKADPDPSSISEDKAMRVGPLYIRKVNHIYEVACFDLGIKVLVPYSGEFLNGGTRYVGWINPKYFEPLLLGTTELLKRLLKDWKGPPEKPSIITKIYETNN